MWEPLPISSVSLHSTREQSTIGDMFDTFNIIMVCFLDAASGGTYDWGKEKAGIKYAYTPELRPQSSWQGGFDIPASNIYPSGAEIFAGVASICRDASLE